MAPTLTSAIGFEARANTATAPSGNPYWSAVNNAAGISYVTGRLGGWALRVTQDGVSQTNVRRVLTSATDIVVSIYGWGSAAPSVTSDILIVADTAGVTIGRFSLNTSGQIRATAGVATAVVGPVVTDGEDHLFEFHINTAATTWTMDWTVDGVSQTQATGTGVAGLGIVRLVFGSATASHTATWNWDDCVVSSTAGDYPISDDLAGGTDLWVQQLTPNAEGTDSLGVSNPITLTGAATGWQVLDALASGDAAAGTYVSYTSTTTGGAASNYAEVALANIDSRTTEVWGVQGAAVCSSAAAGANTLTVRVVESDGTQRGDIVAGSTNNASALSYFQALISAPGAGWLAALDGTKVRVGLSTDTNPLPRCHAVVLEAATVIATAQTVTIGLIDQTAVPLTPVIAGSKTVVLGFIDQSGVTFSPSVTGFSGYENTFDGGTNGVTITAGNSGGASGDAFDQVNVGAGSTIVFDTGDVLHGAASAAVDPVAGITDYFEYRPASYNEWFARLYIKLSVLPPNTSAILLFRDSATATNRGQFSLTTTGQVRAVNGAGTTVGTTTATLTAGSWSRIEFHWFGDASSGIMEAKLFNTVESTSPTETLTVTGTNTTGTIDRIRFGLVGSIAGNMAVFRFDNTKFSTTGYPGPWFATAQTVTIGLVSAPVQVFSPAVTQSVSLGLINQTAVTQTAPTFSNAGADQVVGLSVIGGGWGSDPWGTVFGSTGSQPFAINVIRGINIGLIDNSAVVFQASVNPNFISLGAIPRAGDIISLDQVTFKPALPLIDNSAVTFTPVVQYEQTVTIGLINQTGVTFTPSVGPQTVTLGLINAGVGVFALSDITIANQNVTLALIGSSVQVFAPTFFQFNNQTVTIALIDNSAVIYEIEEAANAGASTVTLTLIDQSAVTFTPSGVRPPRSTSHKRAKYSDGLIRDKRATYSPTISKRAREDPTE